MTPSQKGRKKGKSGQYSRIGSKNCQPRRRFSPAKNQPTPCHRPADGPAAS